MTDFYQEHLNKAINEEDTLHLADRKKWQKSIIKSFNIPNVEYYNLKDNEAYKETLPFEKFKIKPGLLQNFAKLSSSISLSSKYTSCSEDEEELNHIDPEVSNENISEFQKEMASIIFSYHDIFYPQRTPENGTLLRNLYCLHILNHAHATRQTILTNNMKLENGERGHTAKKLKTHPKSLALHDDLDYRDRGFTRPKTLMVLPFRNSAFKIVQTLIALTSTASTNNKLVTNKRRFYQEFQDSDGDSNIKHHSEDRRELFSGNVDDCFKLGIGLGKKSLKLYTDFYASDIILCSPLGLKTLGAATKKVVGAKHHSDLTNGRLTETEINEKEVVDESLDFLSSIEILVLDEADVFLMQNWSHVDYLMKMINNRPIKSHDTDFSRVREWCLNGWARHYRQTLIFSRLNCPELNHLFHTHCTNYEGKALVYEPPTLGVLDGISASLTHTFMRIEPDSSDAIESINNRFTFFTDKIMKQISETRKLGRRTLLYIPSYFDFVRIRNYLMEAEIPFMSITEYDDEKHIKRVRKAIREAEGERSAQAPALDSVVQRTLLLLNTERSYFFRHPRLPHVHALVFYQAPAYPSHYADLCLDASPALSVSHVTCTLSYDPTYDVRRLLPLLGRERCAILLTTGHGPEREKTAGAVYVTGVVGKACITDAC